MADARLREFRYRNSTTFQTAFTNAATDYWNTDNSIKLELTAYDTSGLVQEGLEDDTLKTRLHQKLAPTPGLSKGELSFSTYMTGAPASLEESASGAVLRVLMGGSQLATNARTSSCLAGSTTTNVAVDSASTHLVPGGAVLVGLRGDGRAGGEARPVNAVGANWVTVTVAYAGAPNNGDAVVFADTYHFDETANQEYLETTTIGSATADQRQTIGGAGTFEIAGLESGERPTVDVTLQTSSHRYIPANERTSFTSDTDPDSNSPAFSKSIGQFHLGDFGDPTRTCYFAGDFTVSPGIEIEEQPRLCGNNGVGGYEQVMSTPTAEATLLFDEDMVALADDFDAETAKTMLLQLGHVVQKTALIEFPKCYLDNLPEEAVIGNLAGVRVGIHGSEDFINGSEISSSAIKVHQF